MMVFFKHFLIATALWMACCVSVFSATLEGQVDCNFDFFCIQGPGQNTLALDAKAWTGKVPIDQGNGKSVVVFSENGILVRQKHLELFRGKEWFWDGQPVVNNIKPTTCSVLLADDQNRVEFFPGPRICVPCSGNGEVSTKLSGNLYSDKITTATVKVSEFRVIATADSKKPRIGMKVGICLSTPRLEPEIYNAELELDNDREYGLLLSNGPDQERVILRLHCQLID